LHRQRRDAEAHRHVFHTGPCGDHVCEGCDGVGHAHRGTAAVLGDACGNGTLACDQPAKDVLVGREIAGLDQQPECAQAPATRRHAVVAGRFAALGHVVMNDEVLQQALGLDQCRQFADIFATRLAHIEGGRHQARQRNEYQVARREGLVLDPLCSLGGVALVAAL